MINAIRTASIVLALATSFAATGCTDEGQPNDEPAAGDTTERTVDQTRIDYLATQLKLDVGQIEPTARASESTCTLTDSGRLYCCTWIFENREPICGYQN